jgi:glycosyltransferase involved in cell wall biosynthesis
VQEHLEKDFRIPRDRIFLIHNGVDIQFYAPLGDALIQERRKSFRLDKDKRVIGIIARLSDVKGHEYLIRAMPKIIESFSQIRLMIFGRGKLESGLVSLVERLQLQEYVEFHPVVNRTAEVLPIFDVFVMPSLQEGLGISIMEAQAAGIPVVASNVGGIPSLIQHGKTGVLVEPRDYKGIARAIIRLLADPVQARAMGIRSREFIKEIFSAEKMTSDTVAFYQYCMNFRIQQNSSRLLP